MRTSTAHVNSESAKDRRSADDIAADKAVGLKLVRACSRTNTTHRTVADSFGVCEKTVAKLAVGQLSMRVRHVEALPDSAFQEFLNELAAPRGYVVVQLPDSEAVASERAAIEWTVRQAAAFTTMLDAVQDLRFDRSEGAAVADTGMALVRHVLGWVELGRIAQREGVVGVPSKRSSSTQKAAR
jgi:hypothetical protein